MQSFGSRFSVLCLKSVWNRAFDFDKTKEGKAREVPGASIKLFQRFLNIKLLLFYTVLILFQCSTPIPAPWQFPRQLR